MEKNIRSTGKKQFSIVVLISGGGTNLQAIIDSIAAGRIKGTGIAGVISNNPHAFGLERARQAHIPAFCISPRDYSAREEFHRELLRQVDELKPDLIVLAGFLVKIPAAMIAGYPRQIINIHPSLIPSFCGVGCYGLRVHEKALERGVKITGATVHFVDDGMDTGRILLQQAVAVQEDDTPEILQKRVMEQAEHLILPQAIEMLASEYYMWNS